MIRHNDSITDQSLADVLFVLDEEQFGLEASRQAREQFNGFALELKAECITQQHPGRMTVNIINRLLFSRLKYSYVCKPREEAITLTSTIQKKKGACLGLTAVYFALAQELSLPFQPLMYEGHITIGFTGINPPRHIEVSRKGALFSGKIVDGLYHTAEGRPKVLTKQEFIAVYLSNRAAFVLAKKGRLSEALKSLDVATTLFPEYVGAWINRGLVYNLRGDKNNAAASIRRALELNPVSGYKSIAQKLLKEVS